MAEKLIRLPQLQEFKTKADLKYQDKLIAGSNITISGNTISAQTNFGQQTIYNVTIPVSGWSGTSNTVTVQGIAAGDDVEVVGINPTGLTDQQILAANRSLALITYGTTSTDAITFYALNGLPSVDLPVTIRKILNTNVTTRQYSAGDSISLNNGVISATPVFENGHSSYVTGTRITAGTTSNIYTAVRNCKLYISVQVQGTATTAADSFVYLNGVTVFSQYAAPSLKYERIIHGSLILSAGDVVSYMNPYSFDVEVPYTVFYE